MPLTALSTRCRRAFQKIIGLPTCLAAAISSVRWIVEAGGSPGGRVAHAIKRSFDYNLVIMQDLHIDKLI